MKVAAAVRETHPQNPTQHEPGKVIVVEVDWTTEVCRQE
jgi:hypothetical protein